MKSTALLLLGCSLAFGQFPATFQSFGSRRPVYARTTGKPANIADTNPVGPLTNPVGPLPGHVPAGSPATAVAPTTSEVADRFADGTGGLLFGGRSDYSGCGIHRDCFTCMSSPGGQCMWMGATGCIPHGMGMGRGRRNRMMGLLVCAASDEPIGTTCHQIGDCASCTGTSGCIWNRGSCTYSRGDGCLHDPINCANYAHQCPAADATGPAPTEKGDTSLLMANLLSGGHTDPTMAVLMGQAGVGLKDIPGATLLGSRELGMFNGLIGPSLNRWSATTDVSQGGILGLPRGQTLGCMPGDVYCNAAALDPFAPHNLEQSYGLLTDLGISHTRLFYPEYNVPAPYTPPSYGSDLLDAQAESRGFIGPLRPSHRGGHYTSFTSGSGFTRPRFG